MKPVAYIHSLTALRFFAAILVVVFHAGGAWRTSLPAWAQNIVTGGFIGVPFFFVLSGYILGYTYIVVKRKEFTALEFYAARFWRIYPVYLLGFVFAFIVSVAAGKNIGEGAALVVRTIASLSLLQAWWPDTAFWLNGPAWSLSVEVFFYALFPALIRTTTLAGRRLMLISSAAACALALGLDFLFLGGELFRQAQRTLGFANPLLWFPMFLMGVVLSEIDVPAGSTTLTIAAAVLLIAILASGRMRGSTLLFCYITALPSAALIWLLARRTGSIPKGLLLLGEASYALYILHRPIYDLYLMCGGTDISIYVTCSVCISVLVLIGLERPARAWLKRTRLMPLSEPRQHGAVSRFFKHDLTILAGGSAIGHAITICAAPILSRMYSTQQFGHLQVYASLLSFFIVTACFRYETAVLLPEEDAVAANLVAVCLGSAIVAGLIAAIGGYLWFGGGTAMSLCLAVATITAGLCQALTHWAIRKSNFGDVARTKISQSITNVSVQVITGILAPTGQGLIAGDAIARFAAAWSILVRTLRRRDLLPHVTLPAMRKAAGKYRRFPLVSSFSAILNTAGFTVPVLLLSRYYGMEVIGYYALVDRVLSAPAALVGQSVSQLYMSRLSDLIHRDPAQIMPLFIRTVSRMAVIGLVPAALITIGGPHLFAFAFGEQWREAGVYARILSVSSFVGFIAWPVIPTLTILQAQSWQLLWDVLRMLATLSALYLAHNFGASARTAILWFAGSLFLAYILHMLLVRAAIMRASRAPVPELERLAA